jgi:hypothetical protein
VRTVEESTALIDEIVGRCVREAAFAERVLADPDRALAEYRLTQGELDDFRALRARRAQEARAQWAYLRAIFGGRAPMTPPARAPGRRTR